MDRDPAQCGKCHYRGAAQAVKASGGFIEHHEQYEESFQSNHLALDCLDCHDPLAGVIALPEAGEQTPPHSMVEMPSRGGRMPGFSDDERGRGLHELPHADNLRDTSSIENTDADHSDRCSKEIL
ncbi:MAG: hypothetical protein AMJ65_10570 [Phycisphaerae bacterium SG8_4]|nr:MAG: hypothetical protein AMJ65_10570 [Phycisphaerae bacterium SG8_4]